MGKDIDYVDFEGKRISALVFKKTCDNGKTVEENVLEIIKIKGQIDKISCKGRGGGKKLSELKKERKRLLNIIREKVRFEVKEELTIKKDGKYKIAQIIRRKCSEKLQPSVKVGQRYFIVGRDKTKNGADVVVLADITKPTKGDNLVTIRCNSQRFEWKEFTQAELTELNNMSLVPEQHADIISPEEAQMRVMQKIAHETKVLTTSLSPQEQLRVSFVPLVINNLAWMYAEKAKQCAGRDKISFLRDQSRELKKAAEEYDKDQREILDSRHVYKGKEQTKMCAEKMALDLSVLYYSVDTEFMKEVPDYPYHKMRSYAIVAVLLVRFLEEWNREMDEFLKNRFKGEDFRETAVPPSTYKMRKVMKAFVGVEDFNYDAPHIVDSMKIVKNRIRNIEFSIV